MTDLKAFRVEYQARINQYLDNALASQHFSSAITASGNALLQAMRYSLLDGGKRIRPILAYAAAHAVSEPNTTTDALASAVECIHAYSLIHDDLPAMDDDDLRRGKPTCHIAFDEASAILAGDALQCFAFESIINANIPADQALQALKVLAKASGINGMVLGQAIDLSSVDKALPLDELQQMHGFKTGALIKASVALGGISVSATQEQQQQLRHYADAIGLAFQVQDDIIDVTSDTHTLGKQQGSDAIRNKPTYVSLLGLQGARTRADELVTHAVESLDTFGDGANYLRELAHYIVNRDH